MYDIFLGGPWEKFSAEPYKTQFKAAFPHLSCYDPEARQTQHWFDDNLEALRNTKILVVFVPDFPLPGVGPEIGIYYEHRLLMGRVPKIVTIWPAAVEPQWGKQVLAHMGEIVATTAEAIAAVNRIIGTAE